MMAVLRTLHAWIGALLALILIVIGVTGAMLAFKTDYIRATVPEARAKVAASPQVLGAAADRIEHVLHGELSYVVFASERLGIHQAAFTKDRYGYAAADGTLVAAFRPAGRPESFVYELHHFLLAGDRGMKVVGWSGLIAVGLAIVGLIVWLPVWRGFSFRVWPRSGKRSGLLPAHRNLGVLFAIPVMVFCLTGAGMIFYRTAESLLVKLFPGPGFEEEFYPPSEAGEIDWPKILEAAQARFPDATIRAAFWPEASWDVARVRLRQPGEWTPDGRTMVAVEPVSAVVRGVHDPFKRGLGYRLNDSLYPVHAASVGGIAYRLFTAASGLALAALGVFGLWSFLVKPRKKPKPS